MYQHIVARAFTGSFAQCQVLSAYRCREIMRNSPTALRVLKAALNAAEDGQAGIQASHVPLCDFAHVTAGAKVERQVQHFQMYGDHCIPLHLLT